MPDAHRDHQTLTITISITVIVWQRQPRAKVAELRALGADQARLLGLDRAGYRTLIRWDIARRRLGVMRCGDDRWLHPRDGHRVTEEVREAIFAVRQAIIDHGDI
jgi:hypothetical protein